MISKGPVPLKPEPSQGFRTHPGENQKSPVKRALKKLPLIQPIKPAGQVNICRSEGELKNESPAASPAREDIPPGQGSHESHRHPPHLRGNLL